VQLFVPSVTNTSPVGVPTPGATAATLTDTATAWPTSEGFGVCESIVVVVESRFTVCITAVEMLELKSSSPAYDAVRFRVPGDGNVSEHCAAATVPVQVADASLAVIVTFPVGVPAPGAVGVTA